MATDYEHRHSCGCCADAALYIRPYIERKVLGKSVRIYSQPETFCVGERAYNGGYHVDSDWREKLRNADIPEKLIERVGYFLKDNEPVYDDE